MLVTLNPVTGAVSDVIGPFFAGIIEGLAFHPATGALYGIDVSADVLVSIDTNSGEAVTIGSFGGPASMAGLSWSADGSTLYGVDWSDGGLYEIDPNTGHYAATNKPETWGDFPSTIRACEKYGCSGIGIVLTKGDPYVGIDLDNCRDPETGEIEPWAIEIVSRLASYTEVSPSGTGLRIFIKAKLPPGGRKKGNFEVYDSGRYLTVTGDRLFPDLELGIEARQEELEQLHAEVFDSKKEHQKSTPDAGAKTAGEKCESPCSLFRLFHPRGLPISARYSRI